VSDLGRPGSAPDEGAPVAHHAVAASQDGPPPSLEVVTADDGSGTLFLRGEVDLHAVETAGPDLDARLRTVATVHSGDVTFIDSMGLHCLITAAVAARGRQEKVRLVRPSRPVVQMLEITAMTDFFAVED
jgi:anti-sigma B factor antagonist